MGIVLRTVGLAFRHLRFPDLAVAGGGATFVTGDSGTGKSTLLKLMNGVLSPTAGAVYYEGRDIAGLPPVPLRREVLLAGQSAYLMDTGVGDNFAAYYAYREEPPPDAAVMKRCLALCRADFPLDAACATMSGGERQRVFLAICLSFAPKVLMLDEPTSALDAENALGVVENIVQHCREQNATLVAVSHDRSLVGRFADAVVVLGGGEEP